MDQTASQIKNHIEDTRVDLDSNLRELENKVKSATDWRCQFENRPFMFLGLALGGGVLLAKLAGSRHGQRHYDHIPHNYNPTSVGRNDSPINANTSGPPPPTKDAAFLGWGLIRSALIGIAATRVKYYAEEIFPGFAAHYRKAESERAH